MKKLLILNCGGTFNKIYNKISGELEVDKKNSAILEILKSFHNLKYELKNIIFKDSLDFTIKDRREILKALANSKCENCVLIHGTDTMDITAEFLKEHKVGKSVVLTGSMVPFSISNLEATANFAMCVGFLQNNPEKGIYIGMHGVVTKYKNIKKNREIGRFELIKKGKK